MKLNSEFTNVLIIQPAFIGDAILATSVIEKFHQYYPNSNIYFLVRKGNESLFANHPFVKNIWTIDKSKKFSSLYQVFRKIRKMKFDLIINLHRYASSNLITVLSGAKSKIGYDNFPFSLFFTISKKHAIGDGRHERERNHSLIASLTDLIPTRPKLYPSQNDFNFVDSLKSEKYICLFPASIWQTKQWPIQKWIELCNRISSHKIYLMGGKNDFSICNEIITLTKNKKIEVLAGKLTLLQSAALMQKADMNFVNDSGPLHLASAMNAPVTAIFCSTIKSFGFTPLSDVSNIVETKEKLSCRPCGLHGHATCPKSHFKCGNDISAEEVFNCL